MHFIFNLTLPLMYEDNLHFTMDRITLLRYPDMQSDKCEDRYVLCARREIQIYNGVYWSGNRVENRTHEEAVRA